MAKKLGIEVRLSTEVDPKMMRSVLHQFDAAVVAAGARVDLQALPAPEEAGLLVDAHRRRAGEACGPGGASWCSAAARSG